MPLKLLPVDDLRGGRNGADPPIALPDNQAVELLNVDHYDGMIGRKRGGSATVTDSGGTAFTAGIQSLFRHVPGNDLGAAEFWGVDGASIVKRMAVGTAFADVTLDDAITVRPQDIISATLNGKLFLTYGSKTYATTTTQAAATAGVNYVVGAGVTVITVKVWGAAGGADGNGGSGGGGGGFAQADLAVTPGETLSIRVGGGGVKGGTTKAAGGGGGYSGIFRGSTALLIAGGGGGSAGSNIGGPGGGSSVSLPVGPLTGNPVAPGTNGGLLVGGAGADGTSLTTGGGGAGGLNGGGNGGLSATTGVGGGGGGAGTNGGSGGNFTTVDGGQGGGGGSAYLSGTNISTIAGSGINPGNSTDADYGGAAGLGATNANGNPGLAVIHQTAFVDRLHVYDASLASPRVRRVGIAPSAAMTAADTGVGAWPATIRYYRIRWAQGAFSIGTVVWPSPTVRVSEPSVVNSFTPSGVGTGTRLTRPTAPGEGETHWIVEASLDNVTFYELVTVAAATTTYDDSTTGAVLITQLLSDVIGTYVVPTAVKYLLTDGNRLLMAGAYSSANKSSRIWFTPVLGSTDRGDDERIPATASFSNWVDLNENDGGNLTGLAGPLNGVPYAFKYRQVWRLSPTGDVNTPYLPRKISDAYGLIGPKAWCVGRDILGNPCIYFLSPDGPCRLATNAYGVTVIQYLGRDIEDIWATINLAASSVVGHGIYHHDKHQVWFWIATGSNVDPDTKIVFDVLLGKYVEGERLRGGWYKHTGDSAGARCSVMMSNTLGAAMSYDLKPYIGRSLGTAIQRCDTAATDDAGTTFQAYVKTKPIAIAPLGMNVGIGQTTILAKAASGVTITQTIDRDFGLETRTATVSLTPAASETRVIRKVEGSDMSQCGTVQLQWGDSAAVSNTWTIDSIAIPVRTEDPR